MINRLMININLYTRKYIATPRIIMIIYILYNHQYIVIFFLILASAQFIGGRCRQLEIPNARAARATKICDAIPQFHDFLSRTSWSIPHHMKFYSSHLRKHKLRIKYQYTSVQYYVQINIYSIVFFMFTRIHRIIHNTI